MLQKTAMHADYLLCPIVHHIPGGLLRDEVDAHKCRASGHRLGSQLAATVYLWSERALYSALHTQRVLVPK